MRKLPPLRALQVFEAAARQQHFSRAAAELCITQSAVSHQVKLLESFYGHALFQRSGRQLVLTSKGQQLFGELSRIFNELAEISQTVAGDGSHHLRLAVYSSFAIKWLIPRLSDFHRQHPQIKVRLDMITDDPLLDSSNADMFITGQSRQRGYWQTLLHQERLIAVCHPQLLAEAPQVTPQWLWQQALLCVDEGPLGIDWPRWAERHQQPIPMDTQQHLFSHVLLAIEAAIAGQGVALASDFMVHSDIAAGRLTALPLPPLLTGFEFNFLCKQRRLDEVAISSFIRWLMVQTEQVG